MCNVPDRRCSNNRSRIKICSAQKTCRRNHQLIFNAHLWNTGFDNRRIVEVEKPILGATTSSEGMHSSPPVARHAHHSSMVLLVYRLPYELLKTRFGLLLRLTIGKNAVPSLPPMVRSRTETELPSTSWQCSYFEWACSHSFEPLISYMSLIRITKLGRVLNYWKRARMALATPFLAHLVHRFFFLQIPAISTLRHAITLEL